ncbi:hypothetical protein KAX21_04945 [candidate division WOR-3 bacterium]|nr:hypothetical protein [candidate division WOR-3 bacterium]
MKRSIRRGLWFMGLFSALSVPTATLEANEYPEELGFLSEISTPEYLAVSGTMALLDTTDKVLLEAPVRFYWEAEEEKFALDIRIPGGAPGVYILGIADTFWLYDFLRGTKITAFRDQAFSSLSNVPFSAENLLGIFGIFPQGFAETDTFYREGSLLAIRQDRVLFSFDSESKQLLNMTRREATISFYDFSVDKKWMWPARIEMNASLFFPLQDAASTRVNINEVSLKRQRRDNLFDVDLPPNMKRAFDMRGQ